MRRASEVVEKIILGNNRKYTTSVMFSFLSVKNPEAVEIKAPNAVRGSVPDQIVYPYLSHLTKRQFTQEEIGRRIFPHTEMFHIDGNRHRVMLRPYSRIGYIGSRADATGAIDDTITLYIKDVEVKRITLITNPDRIIKEGSIILQDYNDHELTRFDIINNTESKLVIDIPCRGVYRVVLHTTQHTPNKRVWVVAFFPGFEYEVSTEDVVSLKQSFRKTENKEGSIGRLYINSLTLTLNNLSRIYDAQNKDSPIAGYFNSNATLYADLYLQSKENDSIFKYPCGSLYITDIKADEAKPTVEIKAQDYIGTQKSKHLSLGIFDNTDAKHMFSEVARALNLSSDKIDESLKTIKLAAFSLNGTVSKILNNLCVLTNAFCTVSIDGTGLIATPMLFRHGSIRYPLRYFNLDEYKSSNSGENKANSPNIINLSYSKYEYDSSLTIKEKRVLMYNTLPVRVYPDKWKLVPFADRPVGGETEPSIVLVFPLPDNYAGIEFSDNYITTAREYSTIIDYVAKTITVSIWIFITYDPSEQLTVAIMTKEKPKEIVLKTENFEVPTRPQEYIVPAGEPASMSYPDIVVHNEPNTPHVFSISIKDAVSISRVEIGNKFIPRGFEFVSEKTGEGLKVQAWNYTAVPQTLTCTIYGNRLIAGKEVKTITARNEEDIQINGEIIKNISVGALASDAIAQQVLNSMAYYYHHFQSTLSLATWSDPRLELYDLISFKSIRGYGFTQGIIDEMEIEYKGYLTQKIKIKETQKHNRDSRPLGGYICKDRPTIRIDILSYV